VSEEEMPKLKIGQTKLWMILIFERAFCAQFQTSFKAKFVRYFVALKFCANSDKNFFQKLYRK
jgi:hypothetical protein